MPNRRISHDIGGWQGPALVLGVVAAAQAAVLLPTLAAGDVTAGIAASGLIVAALVLATAVLTNVYWRISDSQLAGWLTVSLTIIAAPNLTLAGTVLAEPAAVRSEPFWPLMMQLLISATLLLVALIASGTTVPEHPLAVGLALGLPLSLLAFSLTRLPSPGGDVSIIVLGLAALTALATSTTAWLLLTRTPLSVTGQRRLPVAVLLLTGGQIAAQMTATSTWALAATIAALTAGAVLLCSTTLAWLSGAIGDSRRSLDLLHERLAHSEAALRRDRARLHEIGATVAGIASANRLIYDSTVALPVHRRLLLEEMMETELGRLERIMLDEASQQRVFDVDDVLRGLVVRQQVQGHPVTWTPSGHRATGCPDDIAEVLSVLLDNAAKHGLWTAATLEVRRVDAVVEITVTDSGPGVSPTVRDTLFEWGARGPDSGGQGIGLHIARELVEKQGGYLMLEDSPGPGTTFVVGLLAGERNDAVSHIAS